MTRRLARFPDDVDQAALSDFHERYPDVALAPIAIVIAAFNEMRSVGTVLDSIPPQSCGLDVSVVVVVDGATDGTAEAALAHGAYTCVAPVNRGQGAALRLGYHLARQGGADYIVTTDADGQYGVGDLPTLLKPLIADEADFVTGSRILGRQETRDRIRRLGVHVFAWLATVFTGQRVTDTSFGFRAMRSEVPAAVALTQPQYQSSELLIGVLTRGFRVMECPLVMRVRVAGQTKKGNNLVYGANYARVVFRTWWRERVRRTRAQREQADGRYGDASEEAAAGADR